jgi:hypothetical protein
MLRDPSHLVSEEFLLKRLEHIASLTRSVAGVKQIEAANQRTASLLSHDTDELGVEECEKKNRRANREPDSGIAGQPESASFLKHEQPKGDDQERHDLTQTGVHRVSVGGIELWLSGSCLLCRCPDCQSPMTIQTWLGLADCWSCQTSISLTEEQLAAARELPKLDAVLPTKQASNPAALSLPALIEPALKADATFSETDDSIPLLTDPEHDPQEQELERLTRGSALVRVVRGGMHLTPAWLVSLLAHLILLLILALIMLGDTSGIVERITLSTFLSADKQLGGQFRLENPEFQLQDDLELASQLVQGDQELRNVLQKAQQDAQDLIKDPRPRVNLPDLAQARENITNRPDKLMSFAARDPRVRAEMVAKEGGTTMTEAAVARGLRWLVSVQNKDGSWSLANYDRHADPKNKGDVMGTSLALLPLLGAGQTQEYGIYKESVAAGLAWLIENQLANGDLRAGVREDAGMYAHGQATIVLCEALAMTGDDRLREPAQRAIKFIEDAQHREGGWRYQPGQPGDTSVFGWQMMALQSGRAPSLNLQVSDETLRLADYFLDSVVATARSKRTNRTLPQGAAYTYMPRREATPAMTAEAILCRMYLGWDRNDPRVTQTVKWMVEDHLPSSNDRQLYYWYYATQVMHHFGGEPWKQWNSRMREILISTQQTKGRHPGSWDTSLCSWGSRGGRIYTTSLACCILEVYYRHLPLFEKIEFQ